jgi:hypothetical protein
MNRFGRTLFIVGLVLSIGVAGSFNADSYYLIKGVYRFNYNGAYQLKMAKDISNYAAYSYSAAYASVGGRTGYKGLIDVIFEYLGPDEAPAGTQRGKTKIYLNLSYSHNFNNYNMGACWGSVLAHETSHVYFYQYTGAATWSSSTDIFYYRTFLTESLAFYAGNMVYPYGRDHLSKAEAKALLKSEFAKNKAFVSFYTSGNAYINGHWWIGKQALYQLPCQGYFLANQYGRGALTKLMDYMKLYSMYSGKYIRSSNWKTSRYYFEYAFYKAYGKLAGTEYAPNINYTYKIDLRYLSGLFLATWYY